MRGKLDVEALASVFNRIIPACAGQTVTGLRIGVLTADHPRLCGANSPAYSHVCEMVGSSPLVRGKPGGMRYKRVLGRIIPACAGQTRSSVSLISLSTDHPRLCGANSPTLLAKHSLDYVKRLDLHTPLTFRRRYSTHHHRPNRRYRDALLHPVRRPREGLLAESFSEDCSAGRRISSNPS